MENLVSTQQLWLSLAGGLFAIAGSVVTGAFTYFVAVRQREAEQRKRDLIRAFRDIKALHSLEERYTAELARLSEPPRSAESWKREMRRQLRDEGKSSPSDKATARHAQDRMNELSNETNP